MGFIQNMWLIIKGLVVNWILPLFYIPSNHHVVPNNKNGVASENEGSANNDEGDDDEGDLPEGLRRDMMPRHVAFILDGNRRWAKQRGLTYMEGYEAGVGAIVDVMSMCSKLKIPVLSFFAFSTENWSRPKEEVDFKMGLFEKSLKHNVGPIISKDGRVTVIGDMSRFPASLQKVIKDLEESTKENTAFHVLLAISYSGQYDIVQACQSIANKVKDGKLEPEDVTNTLIQQELKTKISDIPNPDLLIRTSGELRISNFFLWQLAYTELYFTKTYWPDFGEDDFVEALRSFQKRGRRFGRI